jgi:hypothetical protein
MLMVNDAISDELPPTRTYGRRSFVWIPSDGGMLGELIIKLQHAKSGVNRNLEVDTYGVEADTPEPGDHGGRAFWFVNLSDPEQERPYRCVVGGLTPHCDCKAGKCKVPSDDSTQGCKHRDALQYLIENDCFRR